jgi:hypothetical protein
VARSAPHDDLLAVALDVCAAAIRSAPLARRDVKRSFEHYYGHYDRMAMDDSLAGPECLEGYLAFKERRNPSWVPEALRTEGRL